MLQYEFKRCFKLVNIVFCSESPIVEARKALEHNNRPIHVLSTELFSLSMNFVRTL